jgi:hypothetical protein
LQSKGLGVSAKEGIFLQGQGTLDFGIRDGIGWPSITTI